MTELSTSEQTFFDAWCEYGPVEDSEPIPHWKSSDILSPAGRQYEWDFAWPKCRVLVEITGFGRGHQDIRAMARDAAKFRAAMEAGYTVIPITTRCMQAAGDGETKREALIDLCHQVIAIVMQHGTWGG